MRKVKKQVSIKLDGLTMSAAPSRFSFFMENGEALQILLTKKQRAAWARALRNIADAITTGDDSYKHTIASWSDAGVVTSMKLFDLIERVEAPKSATERKVIRQLHALVNDIVAESRKSGRADGEIAQIMRGSIV